MIEKAENKKISGEESNVKNKQLQKYFFPEHGVNIEASSVEEANQKLLEVINKKE